MLKKALVATFLLLAQAAPLTESKAESGCCAVQEDLSIGGNYLGCVLKGLDTGVDNDFAKEMTFVCNDQGTNDPIGEVTVKCLRGSCPGTDPYVHINTHWIKPLMVYAQCGDKVLQLKNIWESRTSMFCPVGDYNAFGWPIEDCEEGNAFWIRRSIISRGTC